MNQIGISDSYPEDLAVVVIVVADVVEAPFLCDFDNPFSSAAEAEVVEALAEAEEGEST